MIFLTCPSCEAKIKMKWVNEGDQIVCYKCKSTSTISRDRNKRFILEEELLDDLEEIVEDIDFDFDDDFLDEDLDEGFEDDFDFFPDDGVEFTLSEEDLDSYGVEIAIDAYSDDDYLESVFEDEDEFGTSFEEYEEEDDIDEDFEYDDEIEFAFEEGEYSAQIDLDSPISGYNVKVEIEDDLEDEEDFEDDLEDEEDFEDDLEDEEDFENDLDEDLEEDEPEYNVEIIREDDED